MKNTLIGLAAALLAAGCAAPYTEAPLATNFPTTTQPKLQAAAHWTVIARDVARQLSIRMPGREPIHIRQAAAPSEFERAFTSQLITSLVGFGHPVMKQPEGAQIVDIDTQIVAFAPSRPQYRYAGAPTTLGANLWAIHEVALHASPGAGTMLALASLDAERWFRAEFATGATPQTEIIITATVSDAQQYRVRHTSVYYAADHDIALYTPPPPPPAAPTPAPERTITVTGSSRR